MPHYWKSPETGEIYDLSHLKSFTSQFDIKFKDGTRTIDVLIGFSNHCFTRAIQEGDCESLIYDIQKQRNGNSETRVFSFRRWEFSFKIPEVVKELAYKGCFQGSNASVLYRLEDQSPKNTEEGWYICMKLDYKPNADTPVQLWVRSAHYRTNRPNNIRSRSTKRFQLLLRSFIERKEENIT